LKPAQVDAVVAGYEAGKTMKELATDFGVNRNTVSSYLRRAGVLLRQSGLDAEQTAGRHQMTWNGTSDNGSALPSGLYVVRAESGAMLRTQKISLVK